MRAGSILFIDDDALLAGIYQRFLTEHGFDVKTASNGRDAVLLCEQEPGVSVVIVDLKMPGVDGVETIAALKERQPDLETIAVSGAGLIPYFKRLSDLGVRHFLSKPFSAEDLLFSINDCTTSTTRTAEPGA